MGACVFVLCGCVYFLCVCVFVFVRVHVCVRMYYYAYSIIIYNNLDIWVGCDNMVHVLK